MTDQNQDMNPSDLPPYRQPKPKIPNSHLMLGGLLFGIAVLLMMILSTLSDIASDMPSYSDQYSEREAISEINDKLVEANDKLAEANRTLDNINSNTRY